VPAATGALAPGWRPEVDETARVTGPDSRTGSSARRGTRGLASASPAHIAQRRAPPG